MKKKTYSKVEAKKWSLHTVRISGNLLYHLFIFKSSKTAGLLHSETAVISLIYKLEHSYFDMLVFVLGWFGSIESVSADQSSSWDKNSLWWLKPCFLLILPFMCIHRAALRTNVTSVFIYLEQSDQWLHTSVDPNLHSGILFRNESWKVNSFFIFCMWSPVCSERPMEQSHSLQWFKKKKNTHTHTQTHTGRKEVVLMIDAQC